MLVKTKKMARAKDSIRQKAEAYYIENVEVDARQIAELYDVHYDTVRAWAKKYNWENQRLDYHASPTTIKQKLQQEALNITEGKPPTFSADSINKLMAAIGRLDKRADPIVVHKILKDLDVFISEIDPAFAAQCTSYHKQFLQHRINLEG